MRGAAHARAFQLHSRRQGRYCHRATPAVDGDTDGGGVAVVDGEVDEDSAGIAMRVADGSDDGRGEMIGVGLMGIRLRKSWKRLIAKS